MSTLNISNPYIVQSTVSPTTRDKYGVISEWSPSKYHIPFLDEVTVNSLSPKKRNLIYKEWLRRVVLLAREDPNVFIELAMTNDWDRITAKKFLKQAWFHENMQILMSKSYAGEDYKYLAMGFPRGSGKTTNVIGRIIWELGRNPNLRIKLVAESHDTAVQRVYEVKTHIERNRWVHTIFPWLKASPKERWTTSSFYVQRDLISRDPSLVAAGILESATGGRADLLIGDDVVGRRNALIQPALRKEVKSTWNSVWMNQLTKEGRVWYIFTPWHKDDLSHEIVANRQWKSFIVKVGKNFETHWIERWERKDLIQLRETLGKAEFSRAYWMEASSGDTSPIVKDWIRFENTDKLDPEHTIQYLLSFDLSVGTTTGDYFAGVIFALDFTDKKVYVVDYINEKYSFPEQVEIITQLTEAYSATWIVVESVAYQKVLADVLKNDPNLGSRLHTFTPSKNKRIRLESITPYLESGKVYFSRQLSDKVIDGKPLLVRQLQDFGIEKYDDLADAFSQGLLFTVSHIHFWDELKGITATVI